MTEFDARTVPADPTSRERLAASGLDYRLVAADDTAALDAYVQAISRGFLDAEIPAEHGVHHREQMIERRMVGVYDESVPDPLHPVATVCDWVAPLSVPGGTVGMWAISDVTVSSTHRRRGIARAMLEGELRAAAGARVPIAGLTVSETTIYGRYGFAPAVPAVRWRIDTRRAGWAGPEPAGKLQYIDRERLAAELAELHDASLANRPGDIPGWRRRWRLLAGLDDEKDGSAVRGVHYLDESGAVRGAMSFRITETPDDFAAAKLSVRHLVAETPDASAALWRFAIAHDLVATVTAELRPVDEPLPWLLRDSRGAEQRLHDHGWLRILDVPAALGARGYAADVDAVLAVTDPLGFAEGTWRLRVTQGSAEVTPDAATEPDVRLDVGALSASYLGGTRLTTLAAAGRVTGDADVLAALDTALRTSRMPHLSIWY